MNGNRLPFLSEHSRQTRRLSDSSQQRILFTFVFTNVFTNIYAFLLVNLFTKYFINGGKQVIGK